MEITQIIGLAAGILTSSSMIPQVIKTIKEKKADEVSLGMLFVLLAGQLLWIYYGVRREDMPIVVTNSFSVLVSFVMIYLRFHFSHGLKPAAGKAR